jgi:hypothetical protein
MWKSAFWLGSSASSRLFSVLVRFKHSSWGLEWWLTSVSRPSTDGDKPAFLAELHELCLIQSGPWLFSRVFNMIYKAEDKNNDKLNRRLMGQFWCFLNDIELNELHLDGRLFTWSNDWLHPMTGHLFPMSGKTFSQTVISSHSPPCAQIMHPCYCARTMRSRQRSAFASEASGQGCRGSWKQCKMTAIVPYTTLIPSGVLTGYSEIPRSFSRVGVVVVWAT